jgi:hypothetical protein
MEYKQFVIKSLEHKPGRWRARIWRANGKPLRAVGRKNLEQFVTTLDAPTPVAAMLMAMRVVDAGTFSRDTEAYTEKFWRRQRRSSVA